MKQQLELIKLKEIFKKQKLPKVILLLLMALVLNIYDSQSQDYKVVLMLGQSNMVGSGRIADTRALIGASLQSHHTIWADIDNRSGYSLKRWRNLSTDGLGSDSSRHGSEYGFSWQLQQDYSGVRFAFIKIAVGATNLASQWKYSSGDIYKRFERSYELAINQLINKPNATAQVVGILWMQGESDAVDSTYASAYKYNLKSFVSGVRGVINTKGNWTKVWNRRNTGFVVPFITGVITDQAALNRACTNSNEYIGSHITKCYKRNSTEVSIRFSNVQDIINAGIYSNNIKNCNANSILGHHYKVRSAQILAKFTWYGKYIPKYDYVLTGDLPRGCGYDNEIHYSSAGLNQMGIRFANKLASFYPSSKTRDTFQGKEEEKETLEISTYPNPVEDIIQITLDQKELQNVSVNIRDINNQLVNQMDVEMGIDSKNIKIDMTKIPDGIYILQVLSNGVSIHTSKVVKLNKN